jgi:chromate transporter
MQLRQERSVSLRGSRCPRAIAHLAIAEPEAHQDAEAARASPLPSCPVEDSAGHDLSCWDLFVIFFKAGLAFGGGPGILAALERELVGKRKVVSRAKLLTTYSLGRLVPTGTMTAVAVALGHQFRGWLGSAVAVLALVLPSTLVTLLLTAAYRSLRDGPALRLLSAVLLPAALAFILAAALKFGKDLLRPCGELVIAVAACVAAVAIGWHPFLILLGGGLIGLLAGNRLVGSKESGKARAIPDARHGR